MNKYVYHTWERSLGPGGGGQALLQRGVGGGGGV